MTDKNTQPIGPTLDTWFGGRPPKCPLPGLKYPSPAEEKRRRDDWVRVNGGTK